MTCHEVRERLSDYADRGLGADETAQVGAHVGGCAACRDLLADLQGIREAARGLGPIAPPEHLALEIAGRIRLEHPVDAAPAPRTTLPSWLGLAAALALVTVGAYLASQWLTPPAPPAVTVDGASGGDEADSTARIEAVVQELGAALEKAIVELQTLARDDDRPTESQVAAQLLDNLSMIDSAIAESRLALASDPDSAPARDSLLEALRRKVGVLQSTMSLINDLRTGDAESAGRSMSNLGKKS